MNQILSVSMPNNDKKRIKKEKQPIATPSILKFFAIFILVFGVFMIGTGVYAIYKNQVTQEGQNLEPTISFENKTDTVILLKIMHQRGISQVQYGWNDDEKTVINANNGKYFEQQINIPSGNNTLHILVKDEDGKEINYEKQYEIKSNLNFEVSGNNIKITYNGDKLISYITYRWDEEEEQRIEINDTDFEQEIEAMRGLHTLTVIAVDEDNVTDTKIQRINGVSKPNLIIDLDSELKHFVIKTSDEDGLSRIELVINEDYEHPYELNLEDMNLKELEYLVPIEFQPGDNFIEVKVYNINGVYVQDAAKVTQRE